MFGFSLAGRAYAARVERATSMEAIFMVEVAAKLT